VSYLLAAFFFTAVLLAAAVTIHMNVRNHWREILLALRGEWGVAARPKAPAGPSARAYATSRQRAAA
jgi:hypothetical protein